MFGWLKKRERKEHIKLLKQNELAAKYLLEIQKVAVQSGLTTDDSLVETFEIALFSIGHYQFELETFRVMPPDRVTDQLSVNKSLRRLYDEVLLGKRAFAKQFGAASEKLERFDAKFQPNEGWAIYISHFGDSMEDKFGN